MSERGAGMEVRVQLTTRSEGGEGVSQTVISEGHWHAGWMRGEAISHSPEEGFFCQEIISSFSVKRSFLGRAYHIWGKIARERVAGLRLHLVFVGIMLQGSRVGARVGRRGDEEVESLIAHSLPIAMLLSF